MVQWTLPENSVYPFEAPSLNVKMSVRYTLISLPVHQELLKDIQRAKKKHLGCTDSLKGNIESLKKTYGDRQINIQYLLAYLKMYIQMSFLGSPYVLE